MKLEVPALEKLVDWAASGVGAIIGSMLGPYMAKQRAKVTQIEAVSRADSTILIASAVQEAKEHLVISSDTSTSVQGELAVNDAIEARLRFQEEKRQRNISACVDEAAELLGEATAPDVEPDHDWAARYFNEVQDVSSEDMQTLWARILAGQVTNPGTTSIHTLSILKNLSPAIAELFSRLCSLSIQDRTDAGQIGAATVLSIGENPTKNDFSKFGLSFADITRLVDHNLVMPQFSPFIMTDLGQSIVYENEESATRRNRLYYQNEPHVLLPLPEFQKTDELWEDVLKFTTAGAELATFVDVAEIPPYTEALTEYFHKKHLQFSHLRL